MEAGLRHTTAPAALAAFICDLYDGFWDAFEAGAQIEMPPKVQITGTYLYAERAFYGLRKQVNPVVESLTTQTNEQAVTRDQQQHSTHDITTTTVADPTEDLTTENVGRRIISRTKGVQENSDDVTHPNGITLTSKRGRDDGDTRTYYTEM